MGFRSSGSGTFRRGASSEVVDVPSFTSRSSSAPHRRQTRVEKRAKFDAVLLDNACRRGIEVREEVGSLPTIASSPWTGGTRPRGFMTSSDGSLPDMAVGGVAYGGHPTGRVKC